MYKNDPFVKHSTTVISTVTAAVVLLEAGETDTLVSVLQDLGARHAAFSRVILEKAHYELVGEALLFTLSKALGAEAFTPTVKRAWLQVYEIITQQMMQGAKEIME
jgi:hemoglobin-like flavoprotein